MESFDDGRDAAARAEVADDLGPDGIAGFDHIVENLVDDVLLKDTEVAVGEEIFLQRLQLEAGLTGHVADGDAAKVGQAGLGADAGELGIIDENLVGLELVLPCLDGGEFNVEAGGGMVVGVARGALGGHVVILPGLTGAG